MSRLRRRWWPGAGCLVAGGTAKAPLGTGPVSETWPRLAYVRLVGYGRFWLQQRVNLNLNSGHDEGTLVAAPRRTHVEEAFLTGMPVRLRLYRVIRRRPGWGSFGIGDGDGRLLLGVRHMGDS